jgi:uncharacterized Ntn-hydrolase superfamily protein
MTKSDKLFIDSTSNKDHELETVLRRFELSRSTHNKEKLREELKNYRKEKGANIKRNEFYDFFETVKTNYEKPR